MILRRRAFVAPRLLAASAVLSACLAGCTPPPPPVAQKAVPVPAPKPLAAHVPAGPGPAAPAPAARAFREKSILFYQPDAVLKSRLADSQAAFATYKSHIERKLAATIGATTPLPGFSAALVIVLKPGGTGHAWLVTTAILPTGFASTLTAAVQTVPPVAVQGGPIAFAIVFDGFGGGGAPVVDAAHPIPIPREWHKQIAPSAVPQGPQGPPAQ
jgi:hypothetical protein